METKIKNGNKNIEKCFTWSGVKQSEVDDFRDLTNLLSLVPLLHVKALSWYNFGCSGVIFVSVISFHTVVFTSPIIYIYM